LTFVFSHAQSQTGCLSCSGGGGGGTVSSVFSRTGAVTAASNDYTFVQIGGFIQNTQLVAGTGLTYNQANGHLDGIDTTSLSNRINTKQATIAVSGENYLSYSSPTITVNAVNLSGTNATGTLAAGRFPALTGDVTTSAGALATTLATVNSNVGTFQGITVNGKGLVTAASNQSYLTANQTITITPTGDVTGSASGTTSLTPAFAIGTNKVTNTMLAQGAANTIKGNNTGSTANEVDMTVTQAKALLAIVDTTIKAYSYTSVAAGDSEIVFEIRESNITIREIRAIRTGGTSASINATKNGSTDLLTANYATTTSMASAGTLQNNTTVIGDIIRCTIRAISGTATEIFIQFTYTKTKI